MVFSDLQEYKNYQVDTACLANKIIGVMYFIIIVSSGFRSTKSQKKGLYVTGNILQFPVTAPGTTSEAKLKINNYSPGDTPYSVSRYGIAALKHFPHEPSVSLVLWSIHVLHISRSTFCLPTTKVLAISITAKYSWISNKEILRVSVWGRQSQLLNECAGLWIARSRLHIWA